MSYVSQLRPLDFVTESISGVVDHFLSCLLLAMPTEHLPGSINVPARDKDIGDNPHRVHPLLMPSTYFPWEWIDQAQSSLKALHRRGDRQQALLMLRNRLERVLFIPNSDEVLRELDLELTSVFPRLHRISSEYIRDTPQVGEHSPLILDCQTLKILFPMCRC